MAEHDYKLIDIDQMEPPILRRRLRPWQDGDAVKVRPLVQAVLRAHQRDAWRGDTFRWEANVIPLFYFAEEQGDNAEQVYDRLLDWFCEAFPKADPGGNPSLRALLSTVGNTEIDLLVESQHYFMFIETKIRRGGKKSSVSRQRKNMAVPTNSFGSLWRVGFWQSVSRRNSSWRHSVPPTKTKRL